MDAEDPAEHEADRDVFAIGKKSLLVKAREGEEQCEADEQAGDDDGEWVQGFERDAGDDERCAPDENCEERFA